MPILLALSGATAITYIIDMFTNKVKTQVVDEYNKRNPQSTAPVASSTQNTGTGGIFMTTSPNRAVIASSGPSWTGVAQWVVFLGFAMVGYATFTKVIKVFVKG